MKHMYICDRDYLPIIFPEYQVVDHGEYIKNNQIYVGAEKVPGDSEAFCVSTFLNKLVILSLPDNLSVVKFAFERKGKKFTKLVERQVPIMDKDMLILGLKYFMATGTWRGVANVDVKIYQMFAALMQDNRQFFSLYFRLVDQYGFDHVWDSMLTFFKRVLDTKADLRQVSAYYRKLITDFRIYSRKIYDLLNFFLHNHFNELMVLDFLMRLRSE